MEGNYRVLCDLTISYNDSGFLVFCTHMPILFIALRAFLFASLAAYKYPYSLFF